MNAPILLVEDADTDIFLIKRVFKTLSIPNPLQVVEDGRRALEYLGGTGQYSDRNVYPPPCLVLLDLRLPYVGGLDVLKWIREQPALRQLAVIVLTSSKESSDVETAYARGANSYLVKPLDLDTLTEMIRSLREFWLGYNYPTSCNGTR